MNRCRLPSLWCLLLCLLLTAVSCQTQTESLIDLRSDTFTFLMPGRPCLCSPANGEQDTSGVNGLQGGFSLCARLQLSDFDTDCELLDLPGILSLRLRQHNPQDIRRQNYPVGKMLDGRVPVLEAALMLRLPEGCSLLRDGQPEVQEMVVGVPLGLLQEPWGEHDLLLNFTGATWDMYVDGRLVDRDFALGYPDNLDSLSFQRNEAVVSRAALYAEPAVAVAIAGGKPERRPVQYFTPSGHNAWVGDVATIWHGGRYHVFYLMDRRGHESKFGRGGHYFEHLSTADFRHWTEHEPAAPIDEQWETLGTGTPFVWHDTLCLAYGMHTSRIWPSERTSSPAQWQHIREQGSSRGIPFAHPFLGDEAFPSGTSYCVSQDGVADFRKSYLLIHPAENPTIYTDGEGRLCMLANYAARGMWTSDRLEGGWHCLSEDFPPGGDCTFLFRWGDYDYIVGGFTHLWMKRAEEDIHAYRDLVAEGLDFYDGLSVPSISEIPGGRCLMAGWVGVNRHWGGPLVIRELLQYPDGHLGSRFMPELMPAVVGRPRSLGRRVLPEAPLFAQADEESFLLTFTVEPQSDALVELDFLSADGNDSCNWMLDLSSREARFGEGRTLREGGSPHQAGDYAIGNLPGLDAPFGVRIVLRGEAKLGGSLIDVEIAGQRTMISHRGGLRVSGLRIAPRGTILQNVRLQALK